MVRSLSLAVVLAASFAVYAQDAPPQPLITHQVNADSSITFRYRAPSALKVELSTDATLKSLPMSKDDAGVWSVTTPVLTPEFYGYTFFVDGVAHLDPRNGAVRPSLTFGSNVIEVPGTTPQPWDTQAIPHGRVDKQVYTTHIAKNLPLNQNTYFVYTPPNYDPQRKGGYPVLYLLHGWSDDASGWTAVGHANDILDSLIASGKAVPMIVVMPLGYGDYTFVTSGGGVWQDSSKVTANVDLFEQTLESEIMPAVEHTYDVAKGRENRAISGLSMGGLETLAVGLRHTDQFAWIGTMSAAVFGEHFERYLSDDALAKATKIKPKLLWVACGVSDRLYPANQSLTPWLRAKGLDVVPVETPGAHTWLVWRDNLLTFAPLLFKQ